MRVKLILQNSVSIIRTPYEYHEGFFYFIPGNTWARGSKGNFTRFDIEDYGFNSRRVHHPGLSKTTEFSVVFAFRLELSIFLSSGKVPIL
jgi:hypothetical protein